MRNIKKHIEQLEEAASQLDKRTPTGARLALLLVDNVIELLMYERIEKEFALENPFDQAEWQRPSKYSPNKKRKIRNNFNPKVNFFVSEMKNMSFDEGEVIKVGHEFRNEAYHNGVLRDSLIQSMTSVYFELVCEMFPRIWVGDYTWNFDEVTTLLQRYAIEGTSIVPENLKEICNQLLMGRTCSVQELSKDLSEDLLRRIDEMLISFESFQKEVHPNLTLEDLLKLMQFHEQFDIFDILRKAPETDELWDELSKIRNKYLSMFKPEIKLKTIERWKGQAARIKKETLPGKAMRNFWNIDERLLKIERMIHETIARFEMQFPY